MNFMETDPDVTFQLHEVKKGPTDPEEVYKEAEMRVREVRRKFCKAEREDEIADRPFKRGWCEEHQEWCPILSKCVPEDPLEKDRYWLMNYRKWEKNVVFYKQKSEKEMRINYAEESVGVLGSWQYKATWMLTTDMKRIETFNLWPFTSYSPWPDHKSIPGEMVDISQEEMRYLMYEKKTHKKEEEYIIFEKNLREAHEKVRSELKIRLSRSIESWKNIPLEYFNSIAEGKEEEIKIRCRIGMAEGSLEHFSLTNCKSCQKMIEFKAAKKSKEDRDIEQMKNKLKKLKNKEQVKVTIEPGEASKGGEVDSEFEETNSEDADNPDKFSEPEEDSLTYEELERKKKIEREDAHHKEWARKYMASTTCNFCKKIFPSKQNRKKHEKRNHSEKLVQHQCLLCEKSFTNSTALNYHTSIKHGEKRMLSCEGGQLKFNSYKEYLEHKKSIRDMHNEKKPKCDKCGQRIARKHMKMHHRNVHQQVILKGHRKPVKLNEPTKTFKCEECKRAFNREENLIRHISEVHIGADKLSCKYCGKLFKRKQHLNVHVLDSHSPFFTHFECHICQKNFGQKRNRDRHIREVHKDSNYQCVQCKKTFNRKSEKERHIKDVHEPSKNFKCPNCEKIFVRKFVQTRHTKTCCSKV